MDLWFSDGGTERRWKKHTSSRKKRAQPQEGCSSSILVETESDDETMYRALDHASFSQWQPLFEGLLSSVSCANSGR